jgi:high-affinity iron transporter
MILTHSIPLLACLLGVPMPQTPQDPGAAARRIAASVALAAQEYRIGVEGGRVTSAAEVEEARLFLVEAQRLLPSLPPAAAGATGPGLDQLLALVARVASPDSVALVAGSVTIALANRMGLVLEQIPAQTPSLAQGAELYQHECASCHGPVGRGDGPGAAQFTPAPADLTDYRRLAGVTPLDFYRRITIGVAGTAMPGFEGRLTADQRWAAALYATVLRHPAPDGEVPPALREFATTARMSDSAMLALVAPGGSMARPDTRARVAAIRLFGTDQTNGDATGQIFLAVRRQVDSALALAARGQAQAAGGAALDAYLTFEQVERGVRARSAGLAEALESGFAALRTRVTAGANSTELETLHRRLLGDLENAERVVSDRLSALNLFTQSFILLLREGLEAILVVGALIAFLMKTQAAHRRRDIHVGVAAAIGASLLTALLLETLFQVSQASQSVLEGAVMLAATAVLFYVSYWLLSKMEVAKWNRFMRGRVQDAVTSGSALALASVAFLAVYREGFETVLFYKALFLTGGGAVLPVLLGMLLGGVVLGIVYYAINHWGVRIPLKPFFGVTSGFLYYMAFVFAGKGIAELQESGAVATTVVTWAPRLPPLGIYPTQESLALQGILLLLLLGGLLWTFVIEPRRLKVTNELVPDRDPASPEALPVMPLGSPGRVEVDMIRSLERMDADLAELRAEVERLRGLLQRTPSRRPD